MNRKQPLLGKAPQHLNCLRFALRHVVYGFDATDAMSHKFNNFDAVAGFPVSRQSVGQNEISRFGMYKSFLYVSV